MTSGGHVYESMGAAPAILVVLYFSRFIVDFRQCLDVRLRAEYCQVLNDAQEALGLNHFSVLVPLSLSPSPVLRDAGTALKDC
jgi:hypothetical protein